MQLTLSREQLLSILAKENISHTGRALINLVIDGYFSAPCNASIKERLRLLVVNAAEGGANKIAAIKALRNATHPGSELDTYFRATLPLADFTGTLPDGKNCLGLAAAKRIVEEILGR